MITFNRRHFLGRGALTVAAVLCSQQIQAQTPSQPGALLPRDKSPRKVIVIGAGIAGLVAAYELTAAGHQVTLLEARERIGGRILTLRDEFHRNSILEAGAARIPVSHTLTLSYIQHFNLRLTQFSPNTGKYITEKDGKIQLVEAANLFSNPLGVEGIKKLSNGFDQLPLAFATMMVGNIKLGTPVTHVLQTPETIMVRCQSGQEYVADYVLCTVPLTVMDEMIFTPALSLAKQEAIALIFPYHSGLYQDGRCLGNTYYQQYPKIKDYLQNVISLSDYD